MDDNGRTLLTIGEVAAYLGQSTGSVRRHIRRDGLPAVRLGPPPSGALRVDARDLDAWLRRQPTAPREVTHA
jgi:excisionase family DNA binding protein